MTGRKGHRRTPGSGRAHRAKIASIAAIPQQFDIARDLQHRVLIVTSEIAGNAQAVAARTSRFCRTTLN